MLGSNTMKLNKGNMAAQRSTSNFRASVGPSRQGQAFMSAAAQNGNVAFKDSVTIKDQATEKSMSTSHYLNSTIKQKLNA